MILRRTERVAVLFSALLLLASGLCGAQWADPSPHIARFVETEPGVKLEVLDWGGSGEPLVLLAGHGDSGHIFDDFAPRLNHDFHVFAITRRGFGFSAQPAKGYDLATMVRDVVGILDALKISRAHLVGHSIAGDEMTRFALTYPARTGKLIYLEAAYDRVASQHVEATFPKLPPSAPSPDDLKSPQSLRSYVGRTEIPMPEAEIRATRVFGPDGRYQRDVTPDWIAAAVARMVEHPDYQAIRSSMLAIYAIYNNPVQLLPRYSSEDPNTRSTIDTIFRIWTKSAQEQRDQFRKAVPRARVIEIEGASHYVFISHPEIVLKEIRTFLRPPG